MGLMCRCGHPMSHHDANECWTNPDGTESNSNTCPCGWWQEVPGSDDSTYAEGNV